MNNIFRTSRYSQRRTYADTQNLPALREPSGIARSESFAPINIDLGNNARLQLSGVYRQQQTMYDVHRIRYYIQEDGYGYKISDVFTNYVVGATGIVVDFGDEVLNKAWEEHEWNPNEPEADFAAIQRFMMLTMIRDGESLYQIVGDADCFYTTPIDILDLPLNSVLRPAEDIGDRIGYTRPYDSGIDRDNLWRPVRYNFRPLYGGRGYTLPAQDVVHTFLTKYAGQQRGLSWFLGALDTMADLSVFEQNISKAVRNAASDPGHYSVAPRWYPAISIEDTDSVDEAKKTLVREVRRDPAERGILPNDIEFKPHDVGNVFQQGVTDTYRKGALARIAACVGLTYNTVAGDFTAANFSSIQQGSLDNRALYRKSQALMLASVKRIVKRWLDWQSLRSARMEARARRCEPQYLLPPFEYVDRQKAAQADAAMLEMGVTAKSILIRAAGQDPKSVMRQIVEDEKMMRDYYEEYGLEYPGDKQDSDDSGSSVDKDKSSNDNNKNPDKEDDEDDE